MVDYLEILRLNSLGYSRNKIAASARRSGHTVTAVLSKAKELNLAWPLDESVTNEILEHLFYPERQTISHSRLTPDFSYIHKELAKKGVNLTLLWSEYKVKAMELNKVPYQYTQFCDKYREWAVVTKATMRIEHKPGEVMQVDWAGATITIHDPISGEERPAYLFVAALPCSCYAYAELCEDMATENWLLCHIHAYNYFGGVTRLLIPDNLKTGVIKNTKYETILNRNYNELAQHYNTAVVPARVRKPKDKSIAEGSVKFATTWIIAALRNVKFFAFADAAKAVKEKLDELNNIPFKKRPGCRYSAYLEEEKEFMQPLPKYSYEIAGWSSQLVRSDYLVTDGKNHYSVPFELIGTRLDVKTTRDVIEVYFNGSRVATHKREATYKRNPIVNPDHMPPEHRKYLTYNVQDFTDWAKQVGSETLTVVNYLLGSGKAPEQGFKACASLTNLAGKYGFKRLENACSRALEYTPQPSIRNISSILKNGQDRLPKDNITPKTTPVKSYGITRGTDYYSKGGGSR